VFVHDRLTGATEQVSVATLGGEGNGGSVWESISGAGRFVTFTSEATTLVLGDTSDRTDVFVHERAG
jgi:hypothetical protein